MKWRLMTFNLRCAGANDGPDHWEHRRGLLTDVIRAAEPDVLAVQECVPLQADWLQDAFPEFGFHGTRRGGERAGEEMCALFWREKRLAAEQTGTFWLSETPDAEGGVGWDAALPRIVTWGRFRDADGKVVTVANAHLDHKGEVARVESCGLIRDRLPDENLVLMGDFNAEPDGEAYRRLTQSKAGKAVLVDVHRALGGGEDGQGTFHAFKGGLDGPRIDWVVASPDVGLISCVADRTERGGRFPSDHYPVCVEVEPA